MHQTCQDLFKIHVVFIGFHFSLTLLPESNRPILIDLLLYSYNFSVGIVLSITGLLPGHLFSSGEMAEGRSNISSALNRLALEIPLDLYCVVFTNIIEHT